VVILPCPLCGDSPWVMFDDRDQTHVVGHFCHYVGVSLACDPSKPEAIRKWNEIMEKRIQ
jgi:hypothetical protein